MRPKGRIYRAVVRSILLHVCEAWPVRVAYERMLEVFDSDSIPNWNLPNTKRQGSHVSCLAQAGFDAFGKGVQLISGSPYAETEQLS